ncbi:MerR family transcriptional regulator [Bacillus tuaregi]|uniref:MerR family transcriptional regulator n=1 Tax=Bacillus tuaregi TaxID=1816695 RepID=UPI0008F8B4D0|nr:MerR family transcriptional regulator [Bacillus tuaregi]
MLINEVCKKCSLTKKAIYYYEKHGLLQPKVEENGYRNYTDQDIAILKEIFVLRSLGLTISDIKKVLASSNKAAALLQYKYLMDVKQQRIQEQQKCLEQLIQNYSVDKAKEYIEKNLNLTLTIKEKLVRSFPGVYGLYLAIHFGPFLNEKIDSPEKEKAYANMIHFLDHVCIIRELEESLEGIMPLMEQEDIENMNTALLSAVEDLDSYLAINQQKIETYIQFRGSTEFKSTPVYRLQQLLQELQESSGYYENFINNLKILSRSYFEYMEKLEKMNKSFLERYPQTSLW